LTGVHPCQLEEVHDRQPDPTHGLTLPRSVCEQLDRPLRRTLFLIAGPDASLWLVSADGLDRLADRLEAARSSSGAAQAVRRVCFAESEPAWVDCTGFMTIPEHMVQFAGFERSVVLVGVGDHFEIWDAQRWQHYLQKHAPAAKSNPGAAWRRADGM
jgi:MraZ protein